MLNPLRSKDWPKLTLIKHQVFAYYIIRKIKSYIKDDLYIKHIYFYNTGLLHEAIISSSPDCNQSSQLKYPKVNVKQDTGVLCARSSLSYGEDEEAIEITEIAEDCEDNLIMDDGM